jgi:carboxymethylenebutenolidase
MSLVLTLALVAPSPQQPDAGEASRARLEASPRHHEWVDVKHGERSVHCFVVYPETKEPGPAVLVIHENKGLTDWVRSVADQLAEAGCVAIAPDLLTGAGPGGGNTDAFASVDAATKAINALDAAQVLADLDAAADHVVKLPAASGKLFVAGFCWGGGKTFAYATHRKGLSAAFVFYGPSPEDPATLASIECPVYGFYGENDARITKGVPATVEAMKSAGKTFEPVTYTGAGHGFMRAAEAPDAAEPTRKAHAEAWKRWKELLASGK